jgi:hypothetical protein
MKSKVFIIILTMAIVGTAAGLANAGGAVRASGAIWAHGELYDTVITPTTFVAPPEHSTDILYNFGMSGLAGQRSVSESAPGDTDFNGGRWDVQMVVFTPQGVEAHDPDGDGIVNYELTDAGEVLDDEALGHIIINEANFYFECPLLPRRNR